jgi:serine/threonine-protein kinase RsbW
LLLEKVINAMEGTRLGSVNRDLAAIGPVADALRASLSGVLDCEGVACVELALVEALTNSIVSGSQALDDPIGVFLQITESDVVVEVEDLSPPIYELFDGAGEHRLDFDPDDIANIPEGGRGLSLIVISMDEVGFRTVGDQVRLRMVRHRS